MPSSRKEKIVKFSPESPASQSLLLMSKSVEGAYKRARRIYLNRKLNPDKLLEIMNILNELEEITNATECKIMEIVEEIRKF